MILLFSCKQTKQELVKEVQKPKITSKVLEKAVLSEGKLIRIDSFPSNNIVPRPVDVWLPENYSSE
jgi:hypothetical protein